MPQCAPALLSSGGPPNSDLNAQGGDDEKSARLLGILPER